MEGETGLIEAPSLARQLGMHALWFKFEGSNPTASYKDRLNAVAVSAAAEYGAPGVTCVSTGNQAVSVAAYSAAASLSAHVFLPPGTPHPILAEVGHYGANATIVSWDKRNHLMNELVTQFGFVPSGRNQPRPWANPYGVEGYRTISFEIVDDLGYVPESICLPTGGGDGLRGVWKGFVELSRARIVDRVPAVIVAQPRATASLVRAVAGGSDHVERVPLRSSIAISLTDRQSGEHALRTLRDANGRAVAVSERSLRTAVRTLATLGVCAEPSAAAGLAGLLQLPKRERPASAVCLVTAAGWRWPATFSSGGGR